MYKSRKFKLRKLVKNYLFFISIFFILIIVLILFRCSTNKNTTIKNNLNSIKKNNVKYSDELYYDLIDEYIKKIDEFYINRELENYQNLAIVKCDGFINFRKTPDEKDTRSIIGLVTNGSACDILEYDLENSIYSKVKSGDMVGYVAKKYLIIGDEAMKIAKQNLKLRVIVKVDKLRIREKPSIDSDEIGTTYKGERYVVVERIDDWVKIEADNVKDKTFGYINANDKYLMFNYCLNEARNQDLKNDVLNYYNNIGVCVARSFVNIRKTAKTNGSIIGKLPGKGGCEVLGSSGNFYKIRSGKVTGYINKDYVATGKKAESLAIQYADLRAIVKIPALKVRTKPSTKAKQWTTITKEETYIVTDQLDGWVEIDIDGGDDRRDEKGYISTANNYVEVRYALDQAFEFKVVTTKKNATTIRDKVKNYAVKFIGNKYVWGGTSLTGGADCSGFVQSIFKNFGISLPRVSKDQAKCGVAVSNANKKVGDLIFYANSDGVINHVAIYIGNNQVVHAANTRSGIRINNYNYRQPVAYRNILGKK